MEKKTIKSAEELKAKFAARAAQQDAMKGIAKEEKMPTIKRQRPPKNPIITPTTKTKKTTKTKEATKKPTNYVIPEKTEAEKTSERAKKQSDGVAFALELMAKCGIKGTPETEIRVSLTEVFEKNPGAIVYAVAHSGRTWGLQYAQAYKVTCLHINNVPDPTKYIFCWLHDSAHGKPDGKDSMSILGPEEVAVAERRLYFWNRGKRVKKELYCFK